MFDIHQSIHDRYDEIDERRVEKYIDGLMREFFASAEAQPVFDEYGDSGWPLLAFGTATTARPRFHDLKDIDSTGR